MCKSCASPDHIFWVDKFRTTTTLLFDMMLFHASLYISLYYWGGSTNVTFSEDQFLGNDLEKMWCLWTPKLEQEKFNKLILNVYKWNCHIAVRFVLSWGLSCEFVFYFESNSPLVSGHLPCLLCPWSDIIPNPVFTCVPLPHVYKVLVFPCLHCQSISSSMSCTKALCHSLVPCFDKYCLVLFFWFWPL